MTSTTFVDRSDPPIAAAWLNDVNNLVYNGVLGTGLVTAAGILAPTVFVSDARLDVQINRTTGEWIGFNTQDAFLSNGVLKAQYGLTLGVDSTLDPINNSVHLSGYGGLAFYTLGTTRLTIRSNLNAFGSSGAPIMQFTCDPNARAFSTRINDFATLLLEGSVAGSTSNGIGFASGGGGGVGIAFSREGGFGTNMEFYVNLPSNTVAGGAVLAMSLTSNGDFQLPGRFFVSASGVATTVPFFPCDPATSINSTAAIYGGTGAPNNATGGNGSYYFRSDTPGSANQRIYVKSGGSWVGIV